MRRFRLSLRHHVALAAIVISAATWLSTGTMAPYATSSTQQYFTRECHYPVNIDHLHFLASFNLIDGGPPESYAPSKILRRLLYPVVSYPFMKTLGFFPGGLLTNLLLLWATLFGLVRYTAKRLGETEAKAAAWLFATYPVAYYWSGLPYLYAILVPCTIFCMILLYEIAGARTLRRAVLIYLALGVLFMGYDLAAFFGPPALMAAYFRKRRKWIIPGVLAMALPNVLGALWLSQVKQLPLVNSNTAIYSAIVNAYLHPDWSVRWLKLVLESLPDLVLTFFYSNFYFLPALFSTAWILFRKKVPLLDVERYFLLTALGIYLFNNWAPPYEGEWQMRGVWISRLYQPLFAVMIFYLIRTYGALPKLPRGPRRIYAYAFAGALILNASLSFGPVLSNPLASWAYYHFYRHSAPDTMLRNLEKFGKRPYGACG